jgi:hypothetical protein
MKGEHSPARPVDATGADGRVAPVTRRLGAGADGCGCATLEGVRTLQQPLVRRRHVDLLRTSSAVCRPTS